MDAAHGYTKNGHPFPIRIILDVVINHSGRQLVVSRRRAFFYFNDTDFRFGNFRRGDRPVPIELRNKDLYHRRGEMRDFDHARRTSTATSRA